MRPPGMLGLEGQGSLPSLGGDTRPASRDNAQPKQKVPRSVAFDMNVSGGDGQLLYGDTAGGRGGSMSRVLSLRAAKGVSSLYDFNADDPAELLASGADLPSMRGVPGMLSSASPRAKMARSKAAPATNNRPAYVRPLLPYPTRNY